MKHSTLKTLLLSKHVAFIEEIKTLERDKAMQSINGKWTAYQQLEHIYLSVAPITKLTQSTTLLLAQNFGMSSRSSRSYDEIVSNYLTVLQTGVKAPPRFSPKTLTEVEAVGLFDKLSGSVDQLCENLAAFTETDLDTYLIPHPVLGNLTLREMLCFTIYHVEHHHKAMLRNLVAVKQGEK